METATTYIAKGLVAIGGGLIAILEPTIPYGLICTLLVFFDCYTASQLCKRLKKKHPDSKVEPFFTSDGMRKAFDTVLKIYAIIICAYLIDVYMIDFVDLHLANIISGAFAFLELWSVLENESSENDATWAKVLQKIMVDKAKKYLDIDLENDKAKETKTASTENN